MKKLIYIFINLLFAAALFSSCEKDELLELPQQGGSEEGALPEILYATIADEQESQTRTYVDGKSVLWQPGDAISFYYGNQQNAHYAYNGETAASSVEFEKVASSSLPLASIHYSRGIYPYDPGINISIKGGYDKIFLNYPETQTYAPNSFGRGANIMIATGNSVNDHNLAFRNACGYLVIKLYGEGIKVKNIVLSSVSGAAKIAGPATIITDDNKIPVTTMSDEAATAVTLDCSNGGEGVALGADAANATEFWFALPPVSFEGGIKIVVTDMNNVTYTKQTTKTVNVTRNNIQPMAALQFVSNTPASNKIWYTKHPDSGIEPLTFYNGMTNPFDAKIKAHYLDPSAGKYVIEFETPVKTIKEHAFYGTALNSIELPDGLKTIEQGAFRETQLTAITIPGSVDAIKTNVFNDCGWLKSIEFLPSPTQKPLAIACCEFSAAEYGPFQLAVFTSINLNRELDYVRPDGSPFEPDELDEAIFYNIYPAPAATVTIGAQVKTIPDYMFAGLKINHLTIPGTVTTIGNDVFNKCETLASVTFEPSPTGQALTLGYNTEGEEDGPFLNSPLTSVNLNREIIYTLASIDLDADDEGIFSGRPLTNGVIIGEQVRTLSDYMFSNSGITSLTIPKTVTAIGSYVFENCTALTSLTFEQSETALEIKGQGNSDGPFYDSPLTTINFNRNFAYKKVNGDEFIPSDGTDGIFAISNSAKKLIATATTINIGPLIQTLSEYIFCNLPVAELTIPNTVEVIKAYAFMDCDNMSTINIADGTNPLIIENYGPFRYSPLTNIHLGREVKWIKGKDYRPYQSPDGLFYTKKYNEVDGVVATLSDNVQTISPYMFSNLRLKSITIPASVTIIRINAFIDCEWLNTIVFEDGSTPLQVSCQRTSYDCAPFYQSPLTSITLGREISYCYDGVDDFVDTFIPTAIEDGLFASEDDVESLSVTLSSNVKTILDYMFAGRPIEQLVIPGTVTTIGNNVFNECDKLTSLTFEPSPTRTALTLGYNTEGEEDGPFLDSPLTTVNLNREIIYTLASIDLDADDEGIFSGRPLTNGVTLGEQVRTLSDYMFSNSGIKSLVIPGTVTTIGDNVFDNCTSLASIRFEESMTPLTIGFQPGSTDRGTFYDSPLNYIYLGRNMTYTNDDLDAADEGLFSNSYKNPTKVDFGECFTTILPYMFSKTGVGAAVNSNGTPTGYAGSLWIPHTITSFGNFAFRDCDKLNTLRLGYDGTTPFPSIGEDVFYDCDNSVRIIVRKRVYDAFMSEANSDGSGWRNYKNQIFTEDNFE